jgi:capsular polysaccharide biosynthesis protein
VRPYFPYLKQGYTTATRLVAPATQRLSRLHGGYLPTGVVATLEEAAAATGGRSAVARPAEEVSRPAAQGVPAAHATFAAVSGEVIPRVTVAELPGGRVLGPNRAVISGHGELVHEVSWYFGTDRERPLEHPLFMHPFQPSPLEISGRVGVLASRGDSNYYHFLVDVLPRLAIMAQCPQFAPPERWYVPAGARFQRELLAMFGLRPDQWIDAAEVPHVRAECLVVPGLPAATVMNPPWVVDFLRRRLLPVDGDDSDRSRGGPEPRRPIYLTRGSQLNNRRVVNEAEVLELLTERGFTVVDPGALSVAEQIRACAGASIIVGAHGAGLTNLMFAAPGAAVVELFPGGHVLPDCYWTLSRSVPGLEYRYLAGIGGSTRQDYNRALVSDIVVDVRALAGILDDLAARMSDSRS